MTAETMAFYKSARNSLATLLGGPTPLTGRNHVGRCVARHQGDVSPSCPGCVQRIRRAFNL